MTSKIVDTNVLLSLFTKRDENQFVEARSFFKQVENGEKEAMVSVLVVNEFIWAAATSYNLERKDFINWLLELFSVKNMKTVEIDKSTLIKILQKMLTKKIDFTDVYLWAIAKDNQIFSFDRDLTKLVKSA